MYNVYAVDPKMFGSDWQSCRYISENFGFSKGRLISDFPSNWFGEVKNTFLKIENVNIRTKIEKKVLKLKNSGSIINPDKKNLANESDWSSMALEHKKRQFCAIISDSKLGGLSEILVASSLTDDEPLFNVSIHKEVPATGIHIANEVTLLLNSSDRVLFIDPYFDVYEKGYQETLQSCLNVIKLDQNEVKFCEVHYSKKCNHLKSPDIFENKYATDPAFKDFLDNVIPERVTLHFFCWEIPEEGIGHHDRFISTTYGGVGVGQGLRSMSANKLLNFDLLSCKKNQSQLTRFRHNSNYLTPIGHELLIKRGGPLKRAN